MSDIKEEMNKQYKRAEENDIKLLQEENKKLKDLCDRYEEEHKTTFEEWKKDINIIDELEKELDLNLKFRVIGVKRLKDKLNELKGKE